MHFAKVCVLIQPVLQDEALAVLARGLLPRGLVRIGLLQWRAEAKAALGVGGITVAEGWVHVLEGADLLIAVQAPCVLDVGGKFGEGRVHASVQAPALDAQDVGDTLRGHAHVAALMDGRHVFPLVDAPPAFTARRGHVLELS